MTKARSADDGLESLEQRLGHSFAARRLLVRALRHRSYVAEHEGLESNERLEFLGDAVLGLVVTDVLFRAWPDMQEGTLAKARAAVVNSEFLAEAAADVCLGRYLYLGKGEDASGGREKPSILADALEAVIGAVYIDAGMEAAGHFVMRFVEHRLDDAVTGEGSKDYKTRLQEIAAQLWNEVPTYTLRAYGPDHAKRFEAHVHLQGSLAGTGSGRSKKQAEQAAARVAWEALVADEEPAGPEDDDAVDTEETDA